MFITVAILMYRIFNTYLYDTNLSALVMGDSSILTYFRFVMLIFKYQYREPDETALDNAGRPSRLHWSVVWNRRQLLDIVTCDDRDHLV